MGLGVQELMVIAIAVGVVFMFGAPKFKEWLQVFKSTKAEIDKPYTPEQHEAIATSKLGYEKK